MLTNEERILLVKIRTNLEVTAKDIGEATKRGLIVRFNIADGKLSEYSVTRLTPVNLDEPKY